MAAKEGQIRLYVVPTSLNAANAFVERLHRHHKPVQGHKFSLAVHDGERVRGVAIVGRPVARNLDDGYTLEVTRVCTDGCANACSALYGAAWRAARALGYERLYTYTIQEEPGTSLRGAGWEYDGLAGGGNWNTKSRPREDSAHQGKKHRWVRRVAHPQPRAPEGEAS